MIQRRIRQRRILLRGAMTAALIAFLFGAAPAVRAEQTDRVDTYLQTEMARNHIPGLSVAVVRNGKVLKLKSYGQANLEWNVATTPQTAFQLASATKPITATALMLLVQEGRIGLDDPIRRYLPDSPASWSGITVRHLANHTSGIPDDLGPASVQTSADGVASAAKRPLDFVPGTKSAYGIGGYLVLQHLLERVTGKPFDVFLGERLLKPLRMESARFDHAGQEGPGRVADLVPRRAAVYEWREAEARQRSFSFPFPAHTYSAGGLYGSASDLALWIAALDEGKLLTGASLDQMWTRGKLQDGTETSFAFGWTAGAYRGRRTVGHSGGPALADILRFVDEKLTIIVLANQQKMYPYLAQGVADRYVPAPTSWSEPGTSLKDTDTKTTAVLQKLLHGFGEGKVDPTLFAPEARQPLVGMIEGFVMPWFRALGPPRTLSLIEDKAEPTNQRRMRRYRVWYGSKPVIWKFQLNQESQIVSMEPTPE